MGARIGKDNSSRIMDRLRRVLPDAVHGGALIIENDAKARSPIRTGTLRRSINTQTEQRGPDRVVAHIGPNTDYAAFLEFGTRKMAARPYMRPALDEKGKEARETILAVLRGALKE